MKYNKIIICTDADVDGYQIRVLLYTVFYRLMPQLLKGGYVYVVESPLYEFETRDGSYFAYSVADRDRLKKELSDKGIIVQRINRSKGLGENNPDMMWISTMNPETRKLVRLEIDPSDDMISGVTNALFGNDINKNRKEFVFNVISKTLSELAETMLAIDMEDNSNEVEADQAV